MPQRLYSRIACVLLPVFLWGLVPLGLSAEQQYPISAEQLHTLIQHLSTQESLLMQSERYIQNLQSSNAQLNKQLDVLDEHIQMQSSTQQHLKTQITTHLHSIETLNASYEQYKQEITTALQKKTRNANIAWSITGVLGALTLGTLAWALIK